MRYWFKQLEYTALYREESFQNKMSHTRKNDFLMDSESDNLNACTEGFQQ
jgi:hypothetical protein